MSTLLIKGGTVVTATEKYQADVYVEGETIHSVGKDLNIKADKTLDASGCLVIPGGIDPHTHMDMPFMGTKSSDTFETGTLAALHGGTTTIIDFAIQNRKDSLSAALAEWTERAEKAVAADYGLHMAVTHFDENVRHEMKDLIENSGITSFKVFMAYKGALMLDDRQIIGVLKAAKDFGGFVGVHAENGDILDTLVEENVSQGNLSPKYHGICHPEIAEEEASGRFADLAWHVGCPAYIVHMTCEGAVNRLRQAQARNQKIFGETCTQYLLLDDSLYDKGFESSKWVMSPPLRKPKDQKSLWSALDSGIVQTVATDHCPFNTIQKKMGEHDFSKIPNGAPGVENRLELIFSEGVMKKRISMNKFVDCTSTAAAKLFGLYPKKGVIAVGSDADIVILDPAKNHKISAGAHHMNCDYSAYEGWDVTGKVRTTILRGTVAVDNGKTLVGRGFGKFISRKKFEEV